MIYIIITALPCLLTIEAFRTNLLLGPADLKMQYLQPCNNVSEDKLKFRLDQKKYNRTVYIWKISLDTKYLVDNSIIIEMNLAVKGQGGYRPGAFYLKKPICEALHITIRNMFTAFLNATIGVDDCPIPPGSYTLDDFYFDNAQFTTPKLYGEYEMTSYLYKDEERIYCLKAYYESWPKED